jgi:hypothetical protein
MMPDGREIILAVIPDKRRRRTAPESIEENWSFTMDSGVSLRSSRNDEVNFHLGRD